MEETVEIVRKNEEFESMKLNAVIVESIIVNLEENFQNQGVLKFVGEINGVIPMSKVRNPFRLSIFRGPNSKLFLKRSDFLSRFHFLHSLRNDSEHMFPPRIIKPIQTDCNFLVVDVAH